MEVRQYHRGRGEVGAGDLGVDFGQHARVGGQVRPVEHPGVTAQHGQLHSILPP